MAEFKRLPTQDELSKMLYQMQLGGKSQQDIINENLNAGSTVRSIPDNIFQKMAGGARIAKEQVNKLGNASDVAKMFPGYTGQTQVSIPTGYSFAPKQDTYGNVTPRGLQTQPMQVDQLLQAIKPADMLGITGAQQAYTDIGMGKAPNPMDVLDVAGLGAAGLGAGKGLLGVAKATKGMPVGMSIKDVGDDTLRIYRGSYDTSPSYLVENNFKGVDAYGGVFGSGNLETAKGFGGDFTYFTDVPKSKVLTNYELNYNIPHKNVKKALLKAMPNINKKYFNDIYKIVVEDVGSDLRNVSDDVIDQFGQIDFGSANNEVQRLRGQVAKNLGYKAIEMQDETGTSYLVAPGAKFSKIENKLADVPEYSKNLTNTDWIRPTPAAGFVGRKRGITK